MTTFTIILTALVVPAIVGYFIAKFAIRLLTGGPINIKRLISTEDQGDFVTVAFEMKSGRIRNFRVRWLPHLGMPNEVHDIDSFESMYGPWADAAKHAATFHKKGCGRVTKVVHEEGDEWKKLY